MNCLANRDLVAKWVGILVGVFTLVGTLVGAGIAWGQHMRADSDQDRRLTVLEERIYKLEWAHDANHPGDGPLHVANKENR